MNYYQFHIGDFRSGTVNMSRKARWIYRDMLDAYYDTEQPLPSDMDVLCDMLGVEDDEERKIVERHLRFKFEPSDAGYTHAVCESVIAEYRAKADVARANGKLGGRPRKNQDKPSGFPDGSDPVPICNQDESGSQTNHKPITNNQFPPIPPGGGTSEVIFNGIDFGVPAPLINKWAEAYTKVSIEEEIVRAAVWAAANPSKRKKNWSRFLNGWLAKAHKNSKAIDEGQCPVDKIIDLYHRQCPNLPMVAVSSDAVLRSLIVERWNESQSHQASDFWKTIFQRANRLNQVYHRGGNVLPRLELICSRSIFRQLEEQA